MTAYKTIHHLRCIHIFSGSFQIYANVLYDARKKNIPVDRVKISKKNHHKYS